MEAISKLVLSIIAAAILVSIVQSFFKTGGHKQLLQLACGLFLAFTLLGPITKVDFQNFIDNQLIFTTQGKNAASYGQHLAQQQLHSIIKQQCEAYILDKAGIYDAQLRVDVTLSQDQIPVPTAVRLQGSVSPFTKQNMQYWIQENLGISKEQQLWIG